MKVEDLDGLKFWLRSGAWCMIRPSGTEPVLRVYVEAPSEEEVAAIHEDARKLVAALLSPAGT
jgi:phosphomannomutase